MEQTPLQEELEKLLKAYEHYFDIQRDVSVSGGQFPATADYHFREENYVATRAHTIYASEQHEYVFFYVTDRLDAETLRQQIDLSREAGLAKVTPHREHMSSYVTLIILAQSIDLETKKAMKHYRFRKNFRLTLHGWMEYHIAALETSTMEFFCNPAGRETRKTLQQIFRPRQNKKGEYL